MPNGCGHLGRRLAAEDDSGDVRWNRKLNGKEWKFNPQRESLKQSWRNLTGRASRRLRPALSRPTWCLASGGGCDGRRRLAGAGCEREPRGSHDPRAYAVQLGDEHPESTTCQSNANVNFAAPCPGVTTPAPPIKRPTVGGRLFSGRQRSLCPQQSNDIGAAAQKLCSRY